MYVRNSYCFANLLCPLMLMPRFVNSNFRFYFLAAAVYDFFLVLITMLGILLSLSRLLNCHSIDAWLLYFLPSSHTASTEARSLSAASIF